MNLTPQQHKAVNEIENHLQIIACAGSGKTEVITRRIAHILEACPEVGPENIIAFTFTEKAAASMHFRVLKALEESGYPDIESVNEMYLGTIHGFCYQLLMEYCPVFKGFKVLDTVKNHLFISRYADSCGMTDLNLSPGIHNVRLFVECIEKMVDDYDNRDKWSENHIKAFENYRSCLFQHGYLDFSQLIFEAVQQIRNTPAVRDYLSTIKYLVVDEYQDIDDLQEKLISCFADAGANICVVGDDDQTIYQFRGSNAENMIHFAQRYPDVTQVRLEQNFRCVPGIVDVADTVIQNNERRMAKRMVSEVKDTGGSEIRAKRFDSEKDEYDAIAAEIERIHCQGTDYSEIAILLRKSKYAVPICESLEEHNIPYETNSTIEFFKGKYFGKFVSTMRILVNVNKAELYDCWKDDCEPEMFNLGFKYLRMAARNGGNASVLPLSGILREFLTKIGILNMEGDGQKEITRDFARIAVILDDYDEIYGDWQLSARLTGVIKFLEDSAAEEYKYHDFNDKPGDGSMVHIMTVHKSKGLEFDTVFLPELEAGEFPSTNKGGRKYWHVLGSPFDEKTDKYSGDLEDERKLFYVAVTRAKRNLFLYYNLSKKQLSTFVKEAANSKFLKIDHEDILVDDDREGGTAAGMFNDGYVQQQEEQQRRKLAKEARKRLMDYYGTAMHAGMRAAGADLQRVSSLSDEAVIEEARKERLI